MSPKTMKLLAKPMLFAAAIIWGTSFFIMKNALDALPPFYLLAIRFTGGAALLALWYYVKTAKREFGGTTGDLAGWFLQLCELACLAGLVLAQSLEGVL